MGSLSPRRRGDFGVKPAAKTRSAAKPSVLCCHLTNTDEDLGGLRLSFVGLTLVVVTYYTRLAENCIASK